MVVNFTSEESRLKALHSYRILDSFPDEDLQSLTKLAASICNSPYAFISLVDEKRLWFATRVGSNIAEAPREMAICLDAINSDKDLFEVPDTLLDPRYSANHIIQKWGIRSYAGVPLINPEGYKLGTLCVLDTVPKQIKNDQTDALKTLARFVISQLELRKSKLELEFNKNKYHKLIQDSGDIIYTCNSYGEFTFINSQIEKLTGYTFSDLHKKHFTSLIVPEWRDKVQDFYIAQYNTKTKETVLEFPIITKSGNVRWVEQTVTFNFGEQGPVSFQGVVRNIDQRKNQENELSKIINAKEQFLADMSHEIKTPLNAISGFADLLKKTELTKEQKDYVSAISASGYNLLNVINDILDHSKIDAGMMRLKNSSFSVSDSFESIAVLFREKAKQKNVSLRFDISEDIPARVSGDCTKFSQIIINLVSNALKFTEKGEIKTEARLYEETPGGYKILIQVSDTGIGIPEDKLLTVFDRFNKASNKTTGKYGGTGLGLSIVKSLVELHKGTIEVRSHVDIGTVFSVVLPFRKSLKRVVITPEQPRNFPKQEQKNSRVLLAEDNELSQKLALKVLSRKGYIVDIASTGKEVIELVNHNRYDIILMDLQMPKLDGFETARIIRQDMNLNIPIIAMTAYTMPSEKEKCMAAGMNDFACKPVQWELLNKKICSLLNENLTETKQIQQYKSLTSVIDLTDIKRISGGDPAFVSEVLELFIRDTPVKLQKIKESLEKQDYAAIKFSAHTMKSSANLLKIKNGLFTLLDKIEELGRNKSNISEIKMHFEKANSICELALAEAQQKINYFKKRKVPLSVN
ncbi:MAG TPA: ATP-binding protein [Emticicia sp.]